MVKKYSTKDLGKYGGKSEVLDKGKMQPKPDPLTDDGFGSNLDPDDPVQGPAEPTTDPKTPASEFLPDDYSGEADAIRGSEELDYTVPGAEDVDTPTSAEHEDPEMTPWDVTREQTVAGQVEDLYDRDSPFFEKARQQSIRANLAGGGQNSAMAGAMGELAAMEVAFKIGSADAATYARSAEFNAAMSNQFSLAEQEFTHKAVLSDQAFEHARSLQTQRVAAQLESIVLDYKGRNQLMDKELDQFFLKAKQDHQYALDLLYEKTDMQMSLNNQLQLSNFFIASFQSVMEAANNPNFTPEQSAAAMREGMAYSRQQWGFLADFLSAYRSTDGAFLFDPQEWYSYPAQAGG
jgi:hypothetical protein